MEKAAGNLLCNKTVHKRRMSIKRLDFGGKLLFMSLYESRRSRHKASGDWGAYPTAESLKDAVSRELKCPHNPKGYPPAEPLSRNLGKTQGQESERKLQTESKRDPVTPPARTPHRAPSYRNLEKDDLTASVEGLTIRAEKPVGTQKGIHFRSLNLEGLLEDWS